LEAAKFKGAKGQSCTLWAMRWIRRGRRMPAAQRWLPCNRNGTR
jgi:hypothetical protein